MHTYLIDFVQDCMEVCCQCIALFAKQQVPNLCDLQMGLGVREHHLHGEN